MNQEELELIFHQKIVDQAILTESDLAYSWLKGNLDVRKHIFYGLWRKCVNYDKVLKRVWGDEFKQVAEALSLVACEIPVNNIGLGALIDGVLTLHWCISGEKVYYHYKPNEDNRVIVSLAIKLIEPYITYVEHYDFGGRNIEPFDLRNTQDINFLTNESRRIKDS